MALNKAGLKNRIITELKAKGFDTDNEYSKIADMAEALANAFVDEVTQNAVVSTNVTISACNYSGAHPPGNGTGTVS